MEPRDRVKLRQFSQLAALGSTLLGPCALWLYTSGRFDFARGPSLASVWLVVIVALAGLLTGAVMARRSARFLGALSVLVNGLIVALYGFLGLFFGLGGSR